ncbi:MAG: hypothetical protein EBQ52_00100 [Synechococcaceae bacterium LLD_019]|nr:hypothetical protein [Synechococcaceae bacterium LLD_019]
MTDSATFTTPEADDEDAGEDLGDLDDLLASVRSEEKPAPKRGRGRRQPDSPSLDKFIPEKGYVKGNIQVVSWRANWLKNNGTVEEWIRIAKWCQQEEVKRLLEDGKQG